MAHVRAASKGKFRIYIYNAATKKYQTYLIKGTRRQADRKAASLTHEQTQGTLVEPTKITTGDYLDQWHAGHDAAPRTLERYGELKDKHLKPAFGTVSLLKLSPLTIQTYYQNASRCDGKGKLSKRTVLHIHRVLREALRGAVRLGILAVNPTDKVKPPRPERSEMKALDEKELKTLFKGFEGHRLYAAVVAAGTTGLRRGELLALRWSDIKLDAAVATLTVSRALEDTKLLGLAFKSPKTDSSRRTIDLLPLTVEVLRKHAVEQKKARLAAGVAWTDQGLVFPALDGSMWRPSNFTLSWIDRVRRVEFTGLRFHDLRHTHASQLLRAGVNPKVVAARLGHSNVATLMNIYAHALPGDQQQAVRTLDAALRAAALPG
jgi:integrase